MSKYYVYELSDSNGVFYVGKGSGNRINTTKCDGSEEKQNRATNCNVNIIHYFDKEKDAFNYENEMIESYGRDNLTNQKAGGGSPRLTDDEIQIKQAEEMTAFKDSLVPERLFNYYIKRYLLTDNQKKIVYDIYQLLVNILFNGNNTWQEKPTNQRKVLVDLVGHLIRKVPHYGKPSASVA